MDARPELHPGPLIPDVLTLQGDHRSTAIWEGEDFRPLRSRAHVQILNGFPVSDEVVEFLRDTPFYGIHKLVGLKFDVDLITALVERWRQETHTFHLTIGEATVTLQDVQVLLGLPIGGKVVTGGSDHPWPDLVEKGLGLRPDNQFLKGSSLNIGWLISNFGGLPQGANLEHRIRAYLLILIATVLLPDKSGNDISLLYLPLLMDLDDLGSYSWGSAVLATLYRNLCRASRKTSRDIGGPLVLLQLWAWERISIGRPIIIRPTFTANCDGVHPFGSQHQLRVDPLGCRWLKVDRKRPDGAGSLRAYRDAFDVMTQNQFKWEPYNDLLQFLPDICRSEPEEYTVIAPMICFDVVELHLPYRVLRQFGWKQGIPFSCDTSTSLHAIDKRGHNQTCWKTYHANYITSWDQRGESRAIGNPDDTPILDYYDPYMVWYRDHTRRFISPLTRGIRDSSYQPYAAQVNLLTKSIGQLHLQCQKEIRSMSPEASPNFCEILTRMRDYCFQTLDQVGHAHIIKQMDSGEDTEVGDDSPLINFTRRGKTTSDVSSLIEEDTPESSRPRKRGRPTKKTRGNCHIVV